MLGEKVCEYVVQHQEEKRGLVIKKKRNLRGFVGKLGRGLEVRKAIQ